MIDLRPYQAKCKTDVRASYQKGNRAPVLVVPTGGGKTVVFASMIFDAVIRGKTCLILVHRVELLRQAQSKLQAFGLNVGLISPKYTPNYSAPVQVAMVQTLKNRLHLYPKFDFIVTDECHHSPSDTYQAILGNYDAHQLGVTATPIRSDGRGLGIGYGGSYDDLILGPTVRELIDWGFLVEPEIYLPPIYFDRKMKKQMGDFSKKQASERVDKRFITGNAVDHYLQLAKYEPGVTFCIDVQHSKNVAEEYRSRGVVAASLDGSMRDNERDRLLKGLADGSLHMLTSCDVISEGTDIPAIAIGVSLRPTDSVGLHLQQIGRTLRPAEGKEKAIWLDHVGNCGQIINDQLKINHGFPDDERNWTLEGMIPEKKEGISAPRITLCKGCYMAYLATASKCPHCGSEKKAEEYVDPKIVEGELKKIEAEQKRNAIWAAKREVYEAKTLEELEKIAKLRGHHRNWAKHVLKSRESKQH